VHYHLAVLRVAGLLRVEDGGHETLHRLRPSALDDLRDRLHDYFSH
jgi:hypothetical protein